MFFFFSFSHKKFLKIFRKPIHIKKNHRRSLKSNWCLIIEMISSHFTIHQISQTLFFLLLYLNIFYCLFILSLPPTSSHHLYNQNPILATTATTPALLHHHHQPTKLHNHRNLYTTTNSTQPKIPATKTPTTNNPQPSKLILSHRSNPTRNTHHWQPKTIEMNTQPLIQPNWKYPLPKHPPLVAHNHQIPTTHTKNDTPPIQPHLQN